MLAPRPIHTLCLACAALSIACGGALPDEALAPETVPMRDLPGLDAATEIRVVEPTFVIDVREGERVAFYVDPEGSVGMLGTVATGASVLDHVALRDASPAVVHHAISEAPVPEALRALHDRLVADGEVEPFEVATSGRAPGWMRFVASANTASPCYNSTFRTNHCEHESYDDYLCKLNSSGSWTWRVGHAHRYKAGFCVQSGASKSVLSFNEHAGACQYWRDFNAIWGFDFSQPEVYFQATSYLTYVWWRPSGAPRRSFQLTGGYASGDTFDWGQRWSRSTECD